MTTIEKRAKSYLQGRYDSGERADIYAIIMADFTEIECNSCNFEVRQLFQKILDKATPQASKSPKKSLTGWWVLNLHDDDMNLIRRILND